LAGASVGQAGVSRQGSRGTVSGVGARHADPAYRVPTPTCMPWTSRRSSRDF
jgi:hypothetical protein